MNDNAEEFVRKYIEKVSLEDAFLRASKSINFISYMKAEFDKNVKEEYNLYHKTSAEIG